MNSGVLHAWIMEYSVDSKIWSTEMDNEKQSNANEETRRAWEENAPFWDDRMGEGNDFVEVLIWPPTERMLNLQAGERVLDIACGNGLYARRLAVLGAEVTAFDFSANMIDQAQKRSDENLHPIQYLVIDATDEAALLSLGKERFDAAICSMALFDMAEIRPLFNALRSLLKANGRFVFSIMHPCFNNPHTTLLAEQSDIEGKVSTRYSVKVHGYITPTTRHGVAIRDQPTPQLYFHRPLCEIITLGFDSGFVLDALEERAFPEDHPSGRDPLSWGGHFHEIPPVLIARMILKK
jgi:2-polyprenyl-3-methyl-5-hydroxy-6-metoxy-1,4-benzoquinol methylase